MIFIQRHDCNKRRLVFQASPVFSATMLTAPVDLIQLNEAGQRFSIIHGLHDLVFEAPSDVIGYADLRHQRQRRQSGFGLCQQVNRQKPHCQRQSPVKSRLSLDLWQDSKLLKVMGDQEDYLFINNIFYKPPVSKSYLILTYLLIINCMSYLARFMLVAK